MLCITSEGGVASPPKEVIHHIATSLNEGPILLQYWSILELFCTPIGPYSQMRDVHSLYPWRMHTPVIRVPARTSQGLFGSSQKGYPLYTTSRCYASPPKEVLCITSEGGVASPPKEVIHHIATSLNEGPILVHSGAGLYPYGSLFSNARRAFVVSMEDAYPCYKGTSQDLFRACLGALKRAS